MAMLENVPDLTLESLNEATQAWAECEYNRKIHSETGQTPLGPLAGGPGCDATQPGQRGAAAGLHPDRAAHPTPERRDGGDRDAPLRGAQPLPASERLLVRYASWDLTQVHLVDEQTGAGALPALSSGQDEQRQRRAPAARAARHAADGGRSRCRQGRHRHRTAACLELMAQQAATGLPPPYLPKDDLPDDRRRRPREQEAAGSVRAQMVIRSHRTCRSRPCR